MSALLNNEDPRDPHSDTTEMKVTYKILNPNGKGFNSGFGNYEYLNSQWDNENGCTKYTYDILNIDFYGNIKEFQSKTVIIYRFYFIKDDYMCISPSKTIIVS